LEEQGDSYKKSLDALVDCLILSKSAVLVKTPSMLSAWSKILNPHLKLILVGTPLKQPRDEHHLKGAGYWPESSLYKMDP